MPNRIVSGTLDFKWPQHKKIVVAFQDLPTPPAAGEPTLDEWIGKFKTVAAAWLKGGAALSCVYLPTPLPAPSQSDVTFNGRQLYSARSHIPKDCEFAEYDLLISFAQMPIWFVDPMDSTQGTKLTGQASVLGSYAQRTDWGTPTMLLGPNQDQLAGKTLRKHLESPEFLHIVAHEIGHALGLAHEHQNPKYHLSKNPALVDDANLKKKLQQLGSEFNTQFDTEELNREVRDPWPMPDPAFSEWREWAAKPNKTRPETLSVMVYPDWSTFLQNSSSFDGSTPNRLSGPTADDLAQLKAMYPG